MRFNRLILLVLVISSSCAPMYIPNSRNTPLFRGQGEFQGTAVITTGIDLQGAYALTDHLGIMGSYSILSENANDPQNTSETFKRKLNYFEGGLGYFNATRSRRIELYAGYGQGESTTTGQYYFFFQDFGQQELIVTGKYKRYFIQPAIGTNNKGFNIAIAPRISFVDFYEFTAYNITEQPNEDMVIFLEPALVTKFPLTSTLNGTFQLGLNFPITGEAFFEHTPIQAAIGIQLHVGGNLRTRVY